MKGKHEEIELARAYRANSGRILAALISQCSDIQLAEDALHDACLQAKITWQTRGTPSDPGAWLYVASKRRMIDVLRVRNRAQSREVAQRLVDIDENVRPSNEAFETIPDERLSLIFTCCHPALNTKAQVALTLRTLCGLSVREIARAFLVSDATMSQRLLRAKNKIKVSVIPYQVPEGVELAERLDSVLSVIYLIYNESYLAFEGQTLTRDDLAREAIRLARLVVELLPIGESKGLLALLLLHQSRRASRCDDVNGFISLEHQDRGLWDQNLMSEGSVLLTTALEGGRVGKYQIQAAISAVHASADSWESTDWAQIIGLYRQLLKFDSSSIARLNMLTAVALSGALVLAKEGIKVLYDELKAYQPYYAVMADIEFRLGNKDSALEYFDKAIAMSRNSVEKNYLISRQARAFGSS